MGGLHAIRMASLANSLSVMANLRTHILYYQTMYGSWPDTQNLQGKIDEVSKLSPEIETIDVSRGDVVIHYNAHIQHLSGHKLSFRKAQFISQPTAPIVWLCGNQPIPDGMHIDSENVTDLLDVLLPNVCK